jgi:hypothetical protein
VVNVLRLLAVLVAVMGLAAVPATRLVVTAEVGPPGTALHTEHATLRCDGSHAQGTGFLAEHPKHACRLVGSGALARIVKAQRSTRACSQIYGGAQQTHVTGHVGANRVKLTVTRTNGCGTADWQTLDALLGDPERS